MNGSGAVRGSVRGAGFTDLCAYRRPNISGCGHDQLRSVAADGPCCRTSSSPRSGRRPYRGTTPIGWSHCRRRTAHDPRRRWWILKKLSSLKAVLGRLPAPVGRDLGRRLRKKSIRLPRSCSVTGRPSFTRAEIQPGGPLAGLATMGKNTSAAAVRPQPHPRCRGSRSSTPPDTEKKCSAPWQRRQSCRFRSGLRRAGRRRARWVRTQRSGQHRTRDGFVWIHGTWLTIVKPCGFKSSPPMIGTVWKAHPQVGAEAVAFGIPDKRPWSGARRHGFFALDDVRPEDLVRLGPNPGWPAYKAACGR